MSRVRTIEPGSRLYLEGYPTQFGSFGLSVIDGETGHTVVLTAAHVAGSLARGFSRDRNVMCGIPAEAFIVGTAIRTIPLAYSDTCRVDAVIVECRDRVKLSNRVGGSETVGVPFDFDEADPTAMLHVRKQGNQTGLTFGELELAGTTAKFKLSPTSKKERIYTDGYYVTPESTEQLPFAKSGDSGSVVVDDLNQPVGMLVAISDYKDPETLGFCVPMTAIMDELNIMLVGTGAPRWQPRETASATSTGNH